MLRAERGGKRDGGAGKVSGTFVPGATCISSGALKVKEAIVKELQKNALDSEVRLIETGCVGPCNLGPLVIIYTEGVLSKVNPLKMQKKLLENTFLKEEW